MSFGLRNTIILLSLILIIIASGEYAVTFGLKGEFQGSEEILERKLEDLSAIREINKHYDEIQNGMIFAKQSYQLYPKYISNDASSASTLKYLTDIAAESDSKLIFNFRNDLAETIDNINVYTFSISGESRFFNLFSFIWKIENYAPLLTISELKISNLEDKLLREKYGVHGVRFGLVIKSYSKNNREPETKLIQNPVYNSLKRPVKNPFVQLVKRDLPANIENLLVVDEAKLIGITGDTAYLSNRQGHQWTLKQGNKVYLGHLSKINSEKGYVEFVLNEGGFLRKVTVKIDFKDSSK